MSEYKCAYFECMCHNIEHSLRISSDPEEEELIIESLLAIRYSLRQRLRIAWDYIRGGNKIAGVGETLLDKDKILQLMILCDDSLDEIDKVDNKTDKADK